MGQCVSDRERADQAASLLLEAQQLRECQERVRHDRLENGAGAAYREDPVAAFDQLDRTSSSFDRTAGSMTFSTIRSDKISPGFVLSSSVSSGGLQGGLKFVTVPPSSSQAKYLLVPPGASPPGETSAAVTCSDERVEDLE